MSNEDLLSSWQDFLKELRKIKARDEHIIIASDINCKLSNDDFGIRGEKPDVSVGGVLVRELISSGKYSFANNSEAVEGGPETCIDPSDNNEISVLDVIILSRSLE